MNEMTILIVEDDKDIQQLVLYNLIKVHFRTFAAESAEEALEIIAKKTIPDLILLDLMLPGMSGLEFCDVLARDEKTKGIPVIMLTAKSEEADILKGLESGAHDYITKPFSPKVLIARIQTVMRRLDQKKQEKKGDGKEIIKKDDLVIDLGKHEVMVNGKTVVLTLTEFNILKLLATKAGWVFSRQQIIDAVRGYEYSITERSVDVQVFGLRKKLDDVGKRIETVRGIGYRFI